MARCAKHPFDEASGSCRNCNAEFCTDCLVYSFGTSKPPFCIPCALVAGGIRRRSRTAAVSVPQQKRRLFGRA